MKAIDLVRKIFKQKSTPHRPSLAPYVPPLPRYELFLRDKGFVRYDDSYPATIGKFVSTLFRSSPELEAVAIGERSGEVTVLTFDFTLSSAARDALEAERPLGVKIKFNPEIGI